MVGKAEPWFDLNSLHGKAPSYLTNCCTCISDVASRRHLRSASRRQNYYSSLDTSHTISPHIGRRAFSVAGPASWNCLCDELREPLLTANSFRQLLVCLLSTSAYSALEVLHIMRYINLLSYLLTWRLLTIRFVNKRFNLKPWDSICDSIQTSTIRFGNRKSRNFAYALSIDTKMDDLDLQ